MPRKLTPQSTLENLKREAKRWLKALRANATEARARLERALPNVPVDPSLRDVQHALGVEHGFPGWTELKSRLAGNVAAGKSRAQLVDWFLENACPDHHVRGGPAHVMARHTAMRLLDRYPEIARDNFFTAVVCGNLVEVQRVLAERPEAASEKSSATTPDRAGAGEAGDLFREIGPKGWDPLLYLSFTRLPLAASNDNAVAIARELLDHGADPNSYFMAGDSRYTPLVGVIGEGEEDRPPHPRRDELVELLLERGAEPYDIQVIYNLNFHGDYLWFLKLIYDQSVKLGRKADWDDPDWSMLDMGGYGSGARFLLGRAVQYNNIELAEWILAHGASADPAPPSDGRMSKRTLYEDALRSGLTEMAELLVRYGATPTSVTLEGIESLAAACFRLDRNEAQMILTEHPEYLRSTVPMFAAAKRDRAGVVKFLLDLGMSADVEDDKKQRALHIAAYDDSVHVGALLIERGAEIDPVEENWGNTPLAAAVYSQSSTMIDLLGRVSRDVWNLTFTGKVERLHEVLAEEPELARVRSETYGTPLFWLPEDEARAKAIVELFLANGADPSFRNSEGQTADSRAERRGMFDVAELLRSGSSSASRPTLQKYETMVENLQEAYRSGDPAAMERHWNDTWHRRSWQTMRTYVQLDLGKRPEFEGRDVDIPLDDARLWIARDHGFRSWQELAEYVGGLALGTTAIAATPVNLAHIDEKGKVHVSRRERDWDRVVASMKEELIPGLGANGQMTDTILRRISQLDHVTALDLSNSRAVTDEEPPKLKARTPQLRVSRLERVQHQ